MISFNNGPFNRKKPPAGGGDGGGSPVFAGFVLRAVPDGETMFFNINDGYSSAGNATPGTTLEYEGHTYLMDIKPGADSAILSNNSFRTGVEVVGTAGTGKTATFEIENNVIKKITLT
jgi:hypothetical protein